MGRKNTRKKAKESFGGKKKPKHGGRREERIYITGTVDMTRMGYGFIISDDIEDDVFVSSSEP